MKAHPKLKLTKDRRVVRRDTGSKLAQLDGPTPWDRRPGWAIEGESGVIYPSAASCIDEIAFRHGLR